MTIIHTREARHDYRHQGGNQFSGGGRTGSRVALMQGRGPRRATAGRRPRSSRPAGAPRRYRGTGVLVSRASHRARPVTPATTVVLALIAGAVTLWLGLVAQFGGVAGDEVEVPGRLAVVQVQAGESLQRLAQRVAPTTPVGDVVERIRELNELESVALTAGQTLIAPVN